MKIENTSTINATNRSTIPLKTYLFSNSAYNCEYHHLFYPMLTEAYQIFAYTFLPFNFRFFVNLHFFFQIHHISFLFLTILIQSYIYTCMKNKLCFTSQICTIIIQFIVHNSWGHVKKICTWNYKNRWHFWCFVSFMSLVWIWIKSF